MSSPVPWLVSRVQQCGLVQRALGLRLGSAEGKERGYCCYRNLWRMDLSSLEEAGLKTLVSLRFLLQDHLTLS